MCILYKIQNKTRHTWSRYIDAIPSTLTTTTTLVYTLLKYGTIVYVVYTI